MEGRGSLRTGGHGRSMCPCGARRSGSFFVEDEGRHLNVFPCFDSQDSRVLGWMGSCGVWRALTRDLGLLKGTSLLGYLQRMDTSRYWYPPQSALLTRTLFRTPDTCTENLPNLFYHSSHWPVHWIPSASSATADRGTVHPTQPACHWLPRCFWGLI